MLVLALVAVVGGGALAGCSGGGGAAAAPAGDTTAQGLLDSARRHAAAKPKPKPAGPQLAALPDTVGPEEYRREVFRYSGGARDPFQSLVRTNSVGPMLADLTLISITYDPQYGNSVAVIRSADRPTPFRVHRGDVVGPMRVVQIRQYEVVFQIEELGFERQVVLAFRRPEVTR